jgi:hypothetical protein
MLQATVHLRGKTECFECQPKQAPKTYPVCTIRNTPDKPIHCIVWAKDLLFQRLFGRCVRQSDCIHLIKVMQAIVWAAVKMACELSALSLPSDIRLKQPSYRNNALTDLDQGSPSTPPSPRSPAEALQAF